MGVPFPPCQHCHMRKATRAKKLCWLCSQSDSIRALYQPSNSKYARRGVGHKSDKLPPCPTQEAPGSLAKLAVMEQRVMMGFEPHHPGDATINRDNALATALWNPLDWRDA